MKVYVDACADETTGFGTVIEQNGRIAIESVWIAASMDYDTQPLANEQVRKDATIYTIRKSNATKLNSMKITDIIEVEA